MSGNSDCLRLCRLMNDSLSHFVANDSNSLTKENEKLLLISLSEILREIQLWIYELNCHSDTQETAVQPVTGGVPVSSCPVLHSNERDCLSNVVADLVGLLGVKSPYIRHLAGNILGTISKFLAESGSIWNVLIRLLCDCMRFALIKVLLSFVPSSVIGFEKLKQGLSSSGVVVLRLKPENFNWSTVAGSLQVLRNIFKWLNQEPDDQLLNIYYKSISDTLSNIPWGALDEIYLGQNYITVDSGGITADEPRTIFLGYFVQFLSSLVLEDSNSSETMSLFLLKTIELLPHLLSWCFSKKGAFVDGCISEYLRHKLLVLMIKLSSQSHLEISTFVSWLQVLHLYFPGLLKRLIYQPESDRDNCLDGSPFALQFSNGDHCNRHFKHLQRMSVFLFLKFSFRLINLQGSNIEKCVCGTQDSCLGPNTVSNMLCCGRKKSLLDLHEWIQGQVSIDLVVDNEIYIQKCLRFSSSFIRLYMHESEDTSFLVASIASHCSFVIGLCNQTGVLMLDKSILGFTRRLSLKIVSSIFCCQIQESAQNQEKMNSFTQGQDLSLFYITFFLSSRKDYIDDLLFKMLLQLLCIPSSGKNEKQFKKDKHSVQDREQEICFHISNLFNPVHLFHQFLLELQYDHQVLLDYLISKDTGTRCAEYLLRCLRSVCNSWHMFMELQVADKFPDVSHSKKRRVLSKGVKFDAEISSSVPVSVGNNSGMNKYDLNCHGSRKQAFEDAKKCLFALKKSVKNLHQKNLFPYNPEVLLKRLTEFQELCPENSFCFYYEV